MRSLNTLHTCLIKQSVATAASVRAGTGIYTRHSLFSQNTSFFIPLIFTRRGISVKIPSGCLYNHPSSSFFPRKNACRDFSSEAATDTSSSSSNISFEPEEVSRRLVDLARKYCKEGCDISPCQKFDSFETREDRPWDCLDTVEYLLDAEDIFGLVIPDEAADGFDTIQNSHSNLRVFHLAACIPLYQDVVSYISETGKKQKTT